MTGQLVDYEAIFHNLPIPALVLTPQLKIVDMNQSYLQISGRPREGLVGKDLFEAFPENPDEPSSTSAANLGASLQRVLATRASDVMPLQRYDVEVPGSPGEFRERYWCPENVPVIDDSGQVRFIVHVVEEVSDLIRKFVEAEAANA
ncbi:MAG TPA: PAS domain-containing protein [Streptosporangiaceae bacterium]|nr:PAS domain-containing protein [Streptosporangiaceae bacterium]